MLDGSLLENNSTSISIRTIPAVADYIGCNERTIRRALKANGIVKNKAPLVYLSRLVKLVGKTNV